MACLVVLSLVVTTLRAVALSPGTGLPRLTPDCAPCGPQPAASPVPGCRPRLFMRHRMYTDVTLQPLRAGDQLLLTISWNHWR